MPGRPEGSWHSQCIWRWAWTYLMNRTRACSCLIACSNSSLLMKSKVCSGCRDKTMVDSHHRAAGTAMAVEPVFVLGALWSPAGPPDPSTSGWSPSPSHITSTEASNCHRPDFSPEFVLLGSQLPSQTTFPTFSSSRVWPHD